MDTTLRNYLDTIKKSVALYKEGKLSTKPYLQSMQDISKWLEEQRS